MNQWHMENKSDPNHDDPSFWGENAYAPEPEPAGGGWLGELRDAWQWDQVAAEVRQEGQARISLLGLPESGKSMLFERLRGWRATWPEAAPEQPGAEGMVVQAYGAFILADLPAAGPHWPLAAEEILMTLGDPNLLLYLIDAEAGVLEPDYRWVTLLRATGRPLVVVLNKCDLLADLETAVTAARHRLGMHVIPISAVTGQNVETILLPSLLDAAPRAAVSLGREVVALRRLTAWRIIRQSALMAGLMSAQPVPFLDLPFQAMLHVGVVLRVGAIYGRAPGGGVGREAIGTVVSYLGLNYLAQAVAKLVPVLGWAVSGVLGTGATLLIGELALRYYEAGARVPLREFWQEGQDRWRRMWRLWRDWLANRLPGRKKNLVQEEIIPITDEEVNDETESKL